MEWALLTTALLMGLAGGVHCLAMCSPACGAAAQACAADRPQVALLALLSGRAVAYTAAGAVVAAGVGLLGNWAGAAAWLRPFWSMLHLAALALGLWLLWAGRQPAWMAALGQAAAGREGSVVVAMPVRTVSMPVPARRGGGRSSIARATVAGSLLVLLPCGLLQSALLVAALASTPLSGAVVMLGFALTSGFSLWAGPALWLRLAGRDRATHWQVAAVRLSGVMLAGASAWALAQRFAPAAFCAVP